MAESGKISKPLTHDISQGCDVVYDLFCDLCDEDDLTIDAEGFCVNCYDYMCAPCIRAHKRNKASKDHTIRTKVDMPMTKPQISEYVVTAAAFDTSTEQCSTHPREDIKYYCKDHKSIGCTLCIITDHKKCENVNYIEDLAQGILDREEFIRLEGDLTDLKVRLRGVITQADSNVRQAEASSKQVSKCFQDLKKRVLETFNRLEIEIQQQMEPKQSKDLEKIKNITETASNNLKEVDNISSQIEMLKTTGKLCKLYILIRNTEERLVNLNQRYVQIDSENHISTYKFEKGTEIQELIDGKNSLGKLTCLPSIRLKLDEPTPVSITAHATDCKQTDSATQSSTYAEARKKIPSFTRSSIPLVEQSSAHVKDHTTPSASIEAMLPCDTNMSETYTYMPEPPERYNVRDKLRKWDHKAYIPQEEEPRYRGTRAHASRDLFRKFGQFPFKWQSKGALSGKITDHPIENPLYAGDW